MSLQEFYNHVEPTVVQAQTVLKGYDTVVQLLACSEGGKELRTKLYQIEAACKASNELSVMDSTGLFFALSVLATNTTATHDVVSIASCVNNILQNSSTRNKTVASCRRAGLHLVFAKKLHYCEFDEASTDIVFNLLAVLIKNNSTGHLADTCHLLGASRGLVAHFACTLPRVQLARQLFRSISSVRYVARDTVRLNHVVGHLQRELTIGSCVELRHAAASALIQLIDTDVRVSNGIFGIKEFIRCLFVQLEHPHLRIGAAQVLKSLVGYCSTEHSVTQAKFHTLPSHLDCQNDAALRIRINMDYMQIESLAHIMLTQQCQQLHSHGHWVLRAYAEHMVLRNTTAWTMHRALLQSLQVLFAAGNLYSAYDVLQSVAFLQLNAHANGCKLIHSAKRQLRSFVQQLYMAANVKFTQKCMTPFFMWVYTTSFGTEMCCPICLEPAADSSSEIVVISCKHRLHKTCLSRWLLKNKSCPICRSPGEQMLTILLPGEEPSAWGSSNREQHKRFSSDDED